MSSSSERAGEDELVCEVLFDVDLAAAIHISKAQSQSSVNRTSRRWCLRTDDNVDRSAVRLQLGRMSITLDTLHRLAFPQKLCTEWNTVVLGVTRELLFFRITHIFISVIIALSTLRFRVAGRVFVIRRARSALIPCHLRRALRLNELVRSFETVNVLTIS